MRKIDDFEEDVGGASPPTPGSPPPVLNTDPKPDRKGWYILAAFAVVIAVIYFSSH